MRAKAKLSGLRILAVVASFGCAALVPGAARAEGPVTGTGKGIAGGVMLGAEMVMIPMAVVGVKAWWPYAVFGAVGSGAGAVGGYFVEQADVAEPSLYMLAGGMALVIPTMIAVLNATAYSPENDDAEGDDDGAEPPAIDAEGEVSIGSLADRSARARRGSMGLFDFSGGAQPRVRLGVPAVMIQPSYTPIEVSKYGLEQQTEVTVTVAAGRF